MNIHALLSKKIQKALIDVGLPIHSEAQIKQSTKASFGDYQVNGVITIAKQLGISSRQLSENVVSALDLSGISHKIEIIDPGFINIFLNPDWLAKQLTIVFSSSRLGVTVVDPQIIVVDYSAPNIAKEMHVGHMRSTIIGDTLVRILIFLGHRVIRANHIGDWGTQFGMLIAYLENKQNQEGKKIELSNLEDIYLASKQNYDKDPAFAELARSYVTKLQKGNGYCRKIWRKLVDITMKQNQKIYDLLNITLTHNDIMGESLYNDMLPDIVSDLKEKGLAIENEGAIVVFLDEFKSKEGKPVKVIIQKKDGAYLYATTDIACAKYRYEVLKANRIIYYTDSRQHQYLMQVWTIVRKAGYIPKSVLLEHHMFGMIFSKDGKPFKTRTGGTIKLISLLNEALDRARNLIITKNPDINSVELEKLVQIIGIGAVKYTELSKNRTTNYIFDWDNMLNFEGNTAPYMQYAYTRICSIIKRSGQDKQNFAAPILINTKQEIQLAVRLLQLEEVILSVACNGTPHLLCSYLYSVSVLFSSFYESCPILNAKNENVRQSRLKLSLLTARTLNQGLELLGIETVDRM